MSLSSRGRALALRSVATLLVAIGFAACISVVAVVRGTLTAPLPFAHAERVLVLHVESKALNSDRVPFAWADWLDLRAAARSLDEVALVRNQTYTLAQEDLPMRLEGARVTTNILPLLGLPLALGGGFTAAPGEPSAEVVVSDRLWRSQFGARRDLIGQRVHLSGTPYTVVGVLPANVRFPTNDVDLLMPMVPFANELERRFRFARAYARLAPGVEPADARAELRAAMADLALRYPESNRDIQVAPVSLRESYVGDRRPLLVTLAVVVALVLAVVCVNVAGLLMAQVVSRTDQYAIRLALGASRARLLRVLLRDTLPPALLGAALGVLVAIGVLHALEIGASEDLAAFRSRFDGMLGLWIALAALCVATIVTALPAFLLGRIAAPEAMRSGAKGATLGTTANRLINGFVAGQMAVTLVVLVAALVARDAAQRLARVELGFPRDAALLFALAVPEGDLPTTAALLERTVDGLASLPGVTAAGVVSRPPLFAGASSLGLLIEGSPVATADGTASADARLVTGDAMTALGMKLLQGRWLDAGNKSEDVIVIDQEFARTYFPGQDPLERMVTFKTDETRPFRIIGIVAPMQLRTLDVPKEPAVYLPSAQFAFVGPLRAPWVVVRSEGGATPSEHALRQKLASIDPALSASQFSTLGTLADAALHAPQAGARALGLLSWVVVLIGGAGVFAMLLYRVELRQRDYGIRMSMGAQARDLFVATVRSGMVLGATGAALGVLMVLLATRLAATQVVGLQAAGPWLLGAAALAVVVLGLVAAMVPAWRASRVAPAVVLRNS